MDIINELRRKVWEKGQIVEGFAPDLYRKDACGAWIMWEKFGMRDSIFGWEIDHICPVSLLKEKHLTEEIIDNLVNLRPLQHQNNASKSNDYPSYMAVVTSDGNKNVYKEQSLTVNSATRKKLEELYSL